MTSIGVGVTTYNRPGLLEQTLRRIRAHTPPEVPIVVVDDGSDTPSPHATFRFPENRGIAAAKNKCLELLADLGVEHLFLFDSDTYPITDDGWWRPYVDSPEPHLMHQFARGPAHWAIHEIHRDDHLVAYDRPRGCMLYVHRSVLDVVGGMHVAWGKHGGEHGDWSSRIHRAGLTAHPYADVAVKTIECLDEQRRGVSSVDWQEHQHWKHVDATRLPRFAEYREQPVPVLVPRRADNGHRDQLWKHLTAHYWDHLTGYRVVEGEHLDGPFNRSAAINTAARMAGNWDVCVVADSDTWVPGGQLDAAVARCRETARLVYAFDMVVELSRACTDHILTGGPLDWTALGIDTVRTEQSVIQSSMLVVPRTLFDRVGGFDEGFVGWSAEDNAHHKACAIMGGEPERITGAAFHLWHPSSRPPGTDRHYRNNQLRWLRYCAARTEDDLRRIRCSL